MAALKGVKTLDMVGGEITKVAYKGAEYEKTDSPVEAGDLFLLKEGHFIGGADVGAFYTTKKYEDGDIVIPTASIGNASYTQSIGKGVAFRKKHVRLKGGDYAKVVDAADYPELAKGDIVKIAIDDESPVSFYCDVISGERAGTSIWMYERRLVHATEAEVAAAKEAEAKRSIESKWAKIGRKVGEYKVGDIAKYRSDGEICEVTKVEGYITMMTAKHGFCPELSEDIELITPVEARFDRS